jgi:WhiB family transcriptional regulator, redox-sensing transcriptional regulator
MTNDDDRRLIDIAARLDRLRHVPRDVLGKIVVRDSQCLWTFTHGEPPQLIGIDTVDRELAWLLCAGCPVQDECLELELRTAGEDTTGVWGALDEDDRHALYPHWRQRGPRLDTSDDEPGGERP